MEKQNQLDQLRNAISAIDVNDLNRKPATSPSAQTGYRFEIFKGKTDEHGKVNKVRSIGSAFLREGQKTYVITLKTFLNERFYLLPNTKEGISADYMILTREPAQHIPRKFFWNSVGEARILDGLNHGIMQLAWDVLADHLYMSLHPIQINPRTETESAA